MASNRLRKSVGNPALINTNASRGFPDKNRKNTVNDHCRKFWSQKPKNTKRSIVVENVPERLYWLGESKEKINLALFWKPTTTLLLLTLSAGMLGGT